MRLNILCVHRRSVNVLLTNPIWVLVTRMQVTSLNAQGKLAKYIFIFLSSLYQKMFAIHLVRVLVSQKSALCSSVTNLSLNKCPLSHNECFVPHTHCFSDWKGKGIQIISFIESSCNTGRNFCHGLNWFLVKMLNLVFFFERVCQN